MYPFFLLDVKKDRGYRFMNPRDNREYTVNLTGYRILEHCDGTRTPEEIARLFSKEPGMSREEAGEYVSSFLDSMTKLGAVAWRDRGPAEPGFGPPQTVYWDVTENCNLRCSHCYYPGKRPGIDELTAAEAMRVADEISASGAVNVVLSGGEPFLRKDFLYLLDHISKLGFAGIDIATNGTLITREVAKKVKKAGAKVQVSIDGDTPALHDEIRGLKGGFEGALRGIRLLQDEGVPVTACTVATRKNVGVIPNIISLTRELGVNYRVQGMMPVGRGRTNAKSRLTPVQMKQLVEYLDSESVPITSYTFTLKEPPDTPVEPETTGACSAAVTACNITAEGSVVPCTHFWGLRADNLRDHSFGWIWENSLLLRYFRSMALAEVKGVCRDCEYLGVCRGGCKVENFLTGDMFGPNKSCWVASELEKKLAGKM